MKNPKAKRDVFWLLIIIATILVLGYSAKHSEKQIIKVIAPPVHAQQASPQTPHDIIYSKPHADILWRIYGLESSYGRNTFFYCKKHGLINDFGFNVANYQCFSSVEEESTTVSAWLDTQLKTKSLSQTLCYYNLGIAYNACRYVYDFLSL